MNNKGFTLIELLVVVAIIAGLAGIGIPKYLELKGEARRGECLQLLPSLGKSARLFYSQVNFAPGRISPSESLKSTTYGSNNGGMMRFPIRGLTDNAAAAGKFFYSYNVGRGGRDSTGFPNGWFPNPNHKNKLGVKNNNAVAASDGSASFPTTEDYIITCAGIIHKANSTGNGDEVKLLASGEMRLYSDNVNDKVIKGGTAFH